MSTPEGCTGLYTSQETRRARVTAWAHTGPSRPMRTLAGWASRAPHLAPLNALLLLYLGHTLASLTLVPHIGRIAERLSKWTTVVCSRKRKRPRDMLNVGCAECTGWPITFSLCQWGGQQCYKWGDFAQMFRVQMDHLLSVRPEDQPRGDRPRTLLLLSTWRSWSLQVDEALVGWTPIS